MEQNFFRFLQYTAKLVLQKKLAFTKNINQTRGKEKGERKLTVPIEVAPRNKPERLVVLASLHNWSSMSLLSLIPVRLSSENLQ